MVIISGCRSVLRCFGTANMKVAWVRAGKLSKREVVRCALSDSYELRKGTWEVLNQDPSLIIKLTAFDGAGKPYFGNEVETLLKCPEAKPRTIARVLDKLIAEKPVKDEIDRAVRIIRAHPLRKEGDIGDKLGALNYKLFCTMREALLP